HGWTYAPSGRCVEIPSLGPAQRGEILDAEAHARAGLELRPDQVGCIRSFPTLEQDGLVYVFLGGDASRARRAPFRTPFWNTPGWARYYMVPRFPPRGRDRGQHLLDDPDTGSVPR